jgi:hypothetical protein
VAVETIEAMLWAHPDELVSITEAVQHTCAPRNESLTRLLIPIINSQPTLAIFACRRSGIKENLSLLMIPELLSLLYFAAVIANWIVGEVFELQLAEIQDSGFTDFHGKQTCAFLGLHGHLHWLWKCTSFYLMPNGFTYVLLWSSTVAARPFYLFSGPLFGLLVLFAIFTLSFKGSFEAGSVWCWSGLAIFAYLIIQPYAFEKDRGEDRDDDDDDEQTKARPKAELVSKVRSVA